MPGAGDGMMLAEFPAEAVDAFVARRRSARRSSRSRSATSAARSRVAAPGNGALASLDAAFAVFAVGMAMTPELGAAVARGGRTARSRRSRRGARRRRTSTSPSGKADARSFYAPATYRRLREVKAEVDPAELFRANHPIPPAAAPRGERRRISRPVRVRARQAPSRTA